MVSNIILGFGYVCQSKLCRPRSDCSLRGLYCLHSISEQVSRLTTELQELKSKESNTWLVQYHDFRFWTSVPEQTE